MRRSFKLTKVLGFIAIALLAITLLSTLVMLLWNNVLTAAVGVHVISFGQALGILVLSKILFGGFRGGGGWRGRGGRWGKEMREKWQNMTPEERGKFRQDWRSRCRGGSDTQTATTPQV